MNSSTLGSTAPGLAVLSPFYSHTLASLKILFSQPLFPSHNEWDTVLVNNQQSSLLFFQDKKEVVVG